jgi:hypothetical protein
VTAIHLLMRFSDKLGFSGDTIEAHAAVIEKLGVTWFGKMGKTLGRDKIDQINLQCEKKIPTFLFLVQKTKSKGYQTYRGNIVQIARELPSKQARYVPKYYEERKIVEYIRLWTKISKLKAVATTSINEMVVASSRSPALVTLNRSMAALFVVRKKMAGDDERRVERVEHQDENDSDWDF